MKTKALLILFLCPGILCAAHADNNKPGYQEVIFSKTSLTNFDISFLRTHRQGKGVEISWGVTSTEGVSGFIVQRSYQDPNDPYSIWENVSSVSCSGARSFKYNDEDVAPGFISYRVWIVLTNGATIPSAVSIVHIMSKHG